MPYCSKCGQKLPASANYCPNCGKKTARAKGNSDTQHDTENKAAKQPQYPTPKIVKNFGKVGEYLTFAIVRFNSDMYDLRYWQKDGSPTRGIRFDMTFIQAALAALRGKDLNALLAATPSYITYKSANSGNTAKIYKILCSTPIDGWDGWNTELSVIEWGNTKQTLTFDLRQWKADHTAPRKRHGLTLSVAELSQLLTYFETAVTTAQ